MTKEANLEAVNSALSKEVRKLQEELKAADKTNMALTARVVELKKALTRMIDLCTVGANPGAFDNGISDSTGTIDEGDFIAGRIIDDARAAITQETRD